MKSVIKFFFLVYAILSTGLYIISCLAPLIHPDHNSLFYFSGLAFPFILLNFLLVALYFGIGKKKFIFLFLLIPGILYSLKFISTGKEVELSGDEIHVYTFNSFSDKLLHENDKEYDRWSAYVTADQNKPDIICLQEHNSVSDDIFPGSKNFNTWTYDRSNLKITTKYDIIKGGEIKDDTGLRFCIFADIQIDTDTVRIYTFHLFSNKISKMLESAENVENPGAKRIISGSDRLRSRIYSAAVSRAHQAKKLRWHMDACRYPIIACGDLNETAQSFSYRQIKHDLNDSFSKGALGFHPTYRKNPSWVRIDYTFTSDEFDVCLYEVLPFAISDHRPVKVALRLGSD